MPEKPKEPGISDEELERKVKMEKIYFQSTYDEVIDNVSQLLRVAKERVAKAADKIYNEEEKARKRKVIEGD